MKTETDAMRITHNDIRRHPAWRDEQATVTTAAPRVAVERHPRAWLVVLMIGLAITLGGWLAR